MVTGSEIRADAGSRTQRFRNMTILRRRFGGPERGTRLSEKVSDTYRPTELPSQPRLQVWHLYVRGACAGAFHRVVLLRLLPTVHRRLQ